MESHRTTAYSARSDPSPSMIIGIIVTLAFTGLGLAGAVNSLSASRAKEAQAVREVRGSVHEFESVYAAVARRVREVLKQIAVVNRECERKAALVESWSQESRAHLATAEDLTYAVQTRLIEYQDRQQAIDKQLGTMAAPTQPFPSPAAAGTARARSEPGERAARDAALTAERTAISSILREGDRLQQRLAILREHVQDVMSLAADTARFIAEVHARNIERMARQAQNAARLEARQAEIARDRERLDEQLKALTR